MTKRGRWIDHWDPDNEDFWAETGEKIAKKNLILSMFAEHIGFSVWVLWTIVVLNLAKNGFALSVSELFLLTLVPNLVGSMLRIPYTFAVPRFGGRAWTTVSAVLLLLPTLLLALVVPSGWLLAQSHDTQLWVLLLCAASAGVGGGNFSSSMANISFFYPEKKKGFALGLNAAGGNLGVAVAQLGVPLVLTVATLAYAGWMWVPFIVAAAALAWWKMDSLTQAKADTRSYVKSLKHGQTWVMSFLYIGTFGSFIGFSFALPLVIKTTFPEFLAGHPLIATKLAGLGFVGALVGSVSRPVGGWLSDKVGGARVTLAVFLGMAFASLGAIRGVQDRSFPLFFGAFVVLFVFAGMGNGSTYKMIPAIFAVLGRKHAAANDGLNPKDVAVDFKRRAAAVIGVAGAIGAFGGVLIQVTLRQASLDAVGNPDWSVPALKLFAASYIVFAGVTWFVYLRTSFAVRRIPSIAAEAAV
jgi:MFS transporter, NNP family, nitrate/nitrite transporter